MCGNDDKLQALYRDLRSVEFDPAEKPCLWENLTDVLEILAVWKGIKPAHVNGCGLRSERLLTALELVAGKHGLGTLRTRPHWSPPPRQPRVPRGFLQWQREGERRAVSTAGQVLWIYRDVPRETSLEFLRRGRVDETQVLGYPACCVRAKHEIGTRLIEALVQGYQRQYGAVTVKDLIRCAERDLPVAWPASLRTTEEDSRRLFPFVQFQACAKCLRRADFPAARINAAMQALAREADADFAHAIREAARTTGGPLAVRAKPVCNQAETRVSQDFARDYPRRNDPCACGSGRKYKRCCGPRC